MKRLSGPMEPATWPSITRKCSATLGLNGEPSSPWTLRFGEKGPLWLEFTVRTKGAHGAYTHASKSATAIAAKIIGELQILEDIPAPEASNLAAALDEAASAIDRAQGAGAARITRRVTVNPGVVHGGLKVNMVASACTFEVDIRLPNGLDAPQILAEIDKIVATYPEVSYRQLNYNPPSWCPPDTEMAQLVRANAKEIAGIDPVPVGRRQRRAGAPSTGADCRRRQLSGVFLRDFGIFLRRGTDGSQTRHWREADSNLRSLSRI